MYKSIIPGSCITRRLMQKFDQIQTLNSHYQLARPFEGCFQSLIKQIHFGKIPPGRRLAGVGLKANIAQIICSSSILVSSRNFVSKIVVFNQFRRTAKIFPHKKKDKAKMHHNFTSYIGLPITITI